MAITTYAELQTAVGNWLDHALFTARIPEFITLFESTANLRLRVRQQETTASPAVTSGQAPLPTDYLSWRRVAASGDQIIELGYVHPSYLIAAHPTFPESGTPRDFSIQGGNILVAPFGSETLIFQYFAKIPALSDSATTNWLLTAHPDLYLFGSLVESEMFGVNDDRAALWKARTDTIFDEIEKLSNKTRGAGAIRTMGPTP